MKRPAKYGLAIAIHPGSEGVGLSGAPNAAGYPTSYFEWHTTLVNSYIAHVTSMLAEGVFTKFPNLKFVLVEGGISWLPPYFVAPGQELEGAALDHPLAEGTAQRSCGPTHSAHYATAGGAPQLGHFHAMLEMFPAEQMLMFSSDYPHWDGDAPDFAVRQFPEHLRARIWARRRQNFMGWIQIRSRWSLCELRL